MHRPLNRLGLATVGSVVALAGAYWLLRAAQVYSMEVREFSAEQAADPIVAGELPERVGWDLPDVGRQRAWLIPADGPTFVVVVHGSPGTGLGMLPFGRALASQGVGVLLLDLPGYGGSEGERLWDRHFRTAIRSAVDFLVEGRGARRVMGVGYSMGTCVLAQAAAEDDRIERLALLAPFTRLEDQLRYQFRSRIPGLASVAVLAARRRGVSVSTLDTLVAAKALGPRPVLLVAGERDSIIPASMAVDLLGAMSEGRLRVLPGVTHAGFLDDGGQELVDEVARFLRN